MTAKFYSLRDTYALGPSLRPYQLNQIVRRKNYWYRVVDTAFFNRIAIAKRYKPWSF